MKKIISGVLAIMLALSMIVSATLPVFAEDSSMKVTNISSTGTSVTATVTGGNKVCYMVYKGYNIIYQSEATISGGSAVLSMPGGLATGAYKISAWCVAGDVQGDVSTFTVGWNGGSVASYGVPTTLVGQKNPAKSRAVTTPYASVYSDAGMSNEIAQLVRHEFVDIIRTNGSIAEVCYDIQSGNGTTTQTDDINAVYIGTGDLMGTGYMYMSAFASPIIATEQDAQREIVELAMARLGTKGVYSQGDRYMGNYLDCSALVVWCYYQAGYTFNQTIPNCVGLGQIVEGGGHTAAIVWRADYSKIADLDDPSVSNLYFTSNDYNVKTGKVWAVEKTDTVSEADLEPGDILLYNQDGKIYSGATAHYDYDDGSGIVVPATKHGDWMVIQEIDASVHDWDYAIENGYGYDHAAIYVGGGKIIEATSPVKNTHLSEFIDNSRNVVAVYRPILDDSFKR